MSRLRSVLLLMTITAVLGQKPVPNRCNRRKVDKCAERLFMIGDSNFVFPKDMSEMNARCREIKSLESCVKRFASECLTKEAKQAVSVLLYGVTKTNKHYCSNIRRKQLLLDSIKCYRPNKAFLDEEMRSMSKKFLAIVGYEDNKLRIPLACCQYYKFKEATVSHISSKCGEVETQEYENIVNGYAQDILNVFCGDYTEDSDKCSKIISKTPKTTDIKAKPNIFVMPMVEIFESLPR